MSSFEHNKKAGQKPGLFKVIGFVTNLRLWGAKTWVE